MKVWIYILGLVLVIQFGFILKNSIKTYRKEEVKTELKSEREELVQINEEIIKKLRMTKTIIIKKDYDGTLVKIITDANRIEKIILMISKATKVTGDITYEGAGNALEMYNEGGKILGISKMYNNNIDFESEDHGYNRYYLDTNDLLIIINS